MKGCLFHMCQAVIRNLKEIGLFVRYKKDEDFHQLLRKVLALPLLPPTIVENCWHQKLKPDLLALETDVDKIQVS